MSKRVTVLDEDLKFVLVSGIKLMKILRKDPEGDVVYGLVGEPQNLTPYPMNQIFYEEYIVG